jgi:hypothetical protein
MRRVVCIVIALALCAGCAGPREPLDIGVKGFPSDVVLGAPEDEGSPPPPPRPPTFVPPNALPAAETILATLPPVPSGLPAPRPEPPAGPCPAADPFAAPKQEAPNSVLAPPVPATYTFRNTGVIEVSGPDARKEPAFHTTIREVRKVAVASDGSFTHEVVSVLNDTITTTSYKTVPIASGGGSGGITITSITTKTGNTAAQTFTPTPAIDILEFPIEVGTVWRGAAVDPNAQTVMEYVGTVLVKRRVDACGTVLDGHVVRINGDVAPCVDVKFPVPPSSVPATQPPPVHQCAPPQAGQSIQGSSRSSFVATYVFGTQYGGITLLEDTVVDSTSPSGMGAHRELVSMINSEPKLAKA